MTISRLVLEGNVALECTLVMSRIKSRKTRLLYLQRHNERLLIHLHPLRNNINCFIQNCPKDQPPRRSDQPIIHPAPDLMLQRRPASCPDASPDDTSS